MRPSQSLPQRLFDSAAVAGDASASAAVATGATDCGFFDLTHTTPHHTPLSIASHYATNAASCLCMGLPLRTVYPTALHDFIPVYGHVYEITKKGPSATEGISLTRFDSGFSSSVAARNRVHTREKLS